MTVQLQWETPNDAANGAHSNIYMNFPKTPKFEGKMPTIHSGGYQRDDQDRFVIREVTTYRSPTQLSLARFLFALVAGLPLGISLHSICWAFVLKREKRIRMAALPILGAVWPQTFYPDPIAEWSIWLIVLGVGSFLPSMFAVLGIIDGFVSSSFVPVIYSVVAIVVALSLIAAYFTGKNVLTVRVDANTLSYARGRGDLQFLTVAWADIAQLAEKSQTSRGKYDLLDRTRIQGHAEAAQDHAVHSGLSDSARRSEESVSELKAKLDHPQ